jgi:hypothetical protein
VSAVGDHASDLAHLQRWLQHVITHPASPSDAERAAAPIGAMEVERVVRPSSRMSALERVGVYQDAYRARLLECLADDYPALRALLGRERFAALCRRYVVEHPPCVPSLNSYGEALPEFCVSAAVIDLCAATPAYAPALLRDLARIEWASVELIHAPSAAPLSADEIIAQQADFGEATLVPVPSMRLLRLGHRMHASYMALRAGLSADPPAPSVGFELLRRTDWQVTHTEIEVAEGELLTSVLAGAPLRLALAAALERGVSEGDVAAYFQRWFTAGLFMAFRAAGEIEF